MNDSDFYHLEIPCLKLFFFLIFLAMSYSMWDISSQTSWSNLHPLHWKHGFLTTGLPGKSLETLFLNKNILKITQNSQYPRKNKENYTSLLTQLNYGCPSKEKNIISSQIKYSSFSGRMEDTSYKFTNSFKNDIGLSVQDITHIVNTQNNLRQIQTWRI